MVTPPPTQGLSVLAQIPFGEKSALLSREARHLSRRLALVEPGTSEGADALERQREVAIAEALPRLRGTTVRQEDGRRVWMLGEHLQGGRRPRHEPLGHGEAVARAFNGGHQISGERQAAERRVRLAPAVHRARRGEGGGKNAPPRNLGEAMPCEPLERAGSRGTAARVEETHGTASGIPDQPELIAADAGHVRIHHGEHGAGGDGGINGGAAGLERVDAGFRGERVRTDHHPARCPRGCPARVHVRLLCASGVAREKNRASVARSHQDAAPGRALRDGGQAQGERSLFRACAPSRRRRGDCRCTAGCRESRSRGRGARRPRAWSASRV